MGFLDRLKGTARQAANPGAQFAERDRIARLGEHGVERRATVVTMRDLGTQLGGGHEVAFELTVHGPDGDYAADTRHPLHASALEGIAAGGEVVVRVDSEDPRLVLVWGAAR